MYIKYLLNLSILLIFLFCNHTKDKNLEYKKAYDFELIHEVTLPLPSGINKLDINGCKLIALSDDSILIIPFISNKRIIFYSITNKKILKDIDISSICKNNLSNIYCFNKDSFLLTYTYHGYSFDENLNDSLIYVLTLKDNNISVKNINLPQTKYFCNRKIEFKENAYVYPSLSNNHLVFFENKLLIPYNRLSVYNIGTKEFVQSHFPVCGVFNIINKKINDANFYDYPYIENNIFYPSDIKDKYYCLMNNKILLRYFYSKNIFILNSNAQYIDKKELKSLLVDSIYPFKEARTNHWGVENINALYLQLNYDNFRKLFYSYVYFPYQRYGKSFFSMIIADSSLNYINELVFDIKLSYHSIFTEKYIISINVNQNNIKLKYYKLVNKLITKNQYDNYINKARDSIKKMETIESSKVCKIIKNNNILNSQNILYYILNIQNIKEPTFASIYIYTDMVCESCVHNVLFDFMINLKNYEKLPIYLHLSGTNKNINKLLDQFYLKTYKNLYIDTNSVYKYFDPFNNATVRMVLYSNNCIQSDTIYTSQGLDTMMNRCFHFFEKYLQIKN
ncbi:MAG: hypothetical protein HPY79_11145 [Bacteroidales bacterium]|nr:hypothetical protein [Bacteroidales bacterium]